MGIARLYFRSLFVMGLMFGGLFAVGAAFFIVVGGQAGLWYLGALFAILWIFIQFLISPWLMDFFLRWIYSLDWISVDQLPPHLSNFIHDLEEDHKFSLKQVGIIRDNNPNAFVYGHFKKNARLVLTEGIFSYLTNEEQQAVVAHEMGHVVHRDFVWMTIASAVPIIAYTLYAGLRFTGTQMARSKDKDASKVSAAVFGIAIGAFIVYIISGYLVLLLSRVREYYADRFSAEVTGRPDDLGRALVKIAYGMIVSESELSAQQKDGKADKKAVWRQSFHKGARSMGIFDGNAAQAMSMTIQGQGKKLEYSAVAAAASWDLSHPWAKVLELNSTHPLAAKRLKALDAYAIHIGREPQYPDLGKVRPPESLWDEFFIEVFLQYVLLLLIIILPLIGAAGAMNYDISPYIGAGFGMLIVTILWWYRKTVKYPKTTENEQILEITFPLTDLRKNGFYEASPVRGKPVSVEGVVVGRGTPGYFLSEDLVVQDKTGIIRLDYQPILFFMSWFFALFRAPSLMGQQVRAIGWYHRAPMPTLKVWKIFTRDRIFHNRWAGLNTVIVLVFLFISLGLFVLGITDTSMT
ncbi:MAG: M48 family metalloprotease [Candidatus Hodarchaeales archaeon]|jgi:Zn-dependent protease with chaperone function